MTYRRQQRAAGGGLGAAERPPLLARSGHPPTSSPTAPPPPASTQIFGTRYNTVELTAGWVYNTRNRGLFADRGMRNVADLPGACPRGWTCATGSVSYKFCRLPAALARLDAVREPAARLRQAAGRHHGVPPYKRFYAGGPDTVRGFLEDTLGPVDSNGNPYGGNLLTVSQTELIVPIAGEVADQRPRQPVLRHGQCLLHRWHRLRRQGPGDPGHLQIQL